MHDKNRSLVDLDKHALIHPYTNLANHQRTGPLVIERGDGIHVIDENGKSYIEGLAGLWSTALGFSEPELAAAAAKQFDALPTYHSFNGMATRPMIELANRLKDMVPISDGRVFFANSGSEINDTVIKLIWYTNNILGRPEKKKIITRMRSYHGVTLATASMTGLGTCHDGFDLPLDRFFKCMCPDYYREGLPGESEEQFSERCADDLRKLIEHEGAGTIAAFYADPVIAGGGVVPPPAGYFDRVQKILKENQILFVADEVICGFGRTGRAFASDTYHLQPDVITVAKALSSAYLPISAAIVAPTIWEPLISGSEKYDAFAHGFTYSGHPVSAAVALRTLEIYEERSIFQHVQSVGKHFAQRIDSFAGHPMVGDIRRVGLLGGIEFSSDPATKAQFDKLLKVGSFCSQKCQNHGLIIRNMGDIIAFCPPLIISEPEIDEMFRRFELALAETWQMAKANA
ncbi:aminotransferase class III-fold pyridoxal phosphate-dependent enzyme [Mesorhizobium sp. M7A.F.Ca.CA.001.09.2.1]|uniref:Aminotransferase n=1 Tax=Mesorhizobium ciceri TaxID=39645 RepID=A0AB38TDR7_9HYPH|nr:MULTISPECIES: aminotransferase [Mesorhizobium]RUY55896.1 aminotransferase class III-fold pyridoxal phosphate-dependent enzyme [Mesorhizobium sp. M7A.F.Ca.CA.001.13.2.1]MDF3218276.1 aminotransferase [Mesorhizobium ciceri]RUY71331.1 aminotransferase class III-fold pyridoxal phosphate-dependent enzyme [Mesorhizobium sp. M7A.F.Ca.CA.001.13.1.1]RUY74436.1 aminotransferase class III-fold pyridoxal phosphate-dependent enzyme [Mesorhizobium sp. M7A.F.Ca.CA.001.05.1.1]RUY80588.1 aminotransferase cla